MSMKFSTKSTPNESKIRGGYYTPDALAKYISQWVAKAGPHLLEPSCGDGAILQFLVIHGQALGVELFADEADKACCATGAEVICSDFFQWFQPKHYGTFDGLAGNPPYIRFGNWEEQYRSSAMNLMRSQGMKPNRLINAWVPFVVASLLAVRPGGRVGLVLPAELLQVGYAAELRSYLINSCSDITVISFKELVFPGILQEVILLLAIKGSSTARIRTVEICNTENLAELTLEDIPINATLQSTEKWTQYFLSPHQIAALHCIHQDKRLKPLGNYAKVNVGVVTGRNSFFCLTDDETERLGLSESTIGLMTRSMQISGTRYTIDDYNKHKVQGLKTHLLAIPSGSEIKSDSRVAEYINLGELEGVNKGYKCSIRKSWWSVPSISVPDGFMLRQISSVLKLTSNEAGVTSTDTVHRVFTKPGVDMNQLAVAACNSITITMSEIMGRSYGGGLLELEPSECVALPIPDPRLVSPTLICQVDELLRQNRITEAQYKVDEHILIKHAGFTKNEILSIRQSASKLRDRRLNRGRSGNSKSP